MESGKRVTSLGIILGGGSSGAASSTAADAVVPVAVATAAVIFGEVLSVGIVDLLEGGRGWGRCFCRYDSVDQ